MNIVANADHRLLAERLLELQSWPSAVVALRDTHDVEVVRAVTRFIAEDPHLQLDDSFSAASRLSMLSVLIFYALTNNRAVLQAIVPECVHTSKEMSATVRRDA